VIFLLQPVINPRVKLLVAINANCSITDQTIRIKHFRGKMGVGL